MSEADLGQQAVEGAWQPPGPASEQAERDRDEQEPDEQRVECDGEVLGTTDIRVTLKPKAIRVCFPRRAEAARPLKTAKSF